MRKKPILVVMAAGMGSRFGGLKQMQPVDEKHHFMIDFSLYDAWRAGFRKAVFVIKKEFEEAFREQIGTRMEQWFEVAYVFQELDRLPEGFAVPKGRVKPWGTGHAVACCRETVDAPFAVINADDFYGAEAFGQIYRYLAQMTEPNRYAMVGYLLGNTLTEHGSVARGICEVQDGMLTDITERTAVYPCGDHARYTEDGVHFTELAGDKMVSMNLWGFSPAFIGELWRRFPAFLEAHLPSNPLKCEFFLPDVVRAQIKEGSAAVQVLPCRETWYGVTYFDDLERVEKAILEMKRQGIYSENVWENDWQKQKGERE